jgi:cobalt-zinc-cadmium efflux system protein
LAKEIILKTARTGRKGDGFVHVSPVDEAIHIRTGKSSIGLWILRAGSEENLNIKGAFLEVVSDVLGSIGVIVAAVIMFATGWYYADAIFSVLIGLFILLRTWKLLVQAVNVLLESTPAQINVAAVEEAMLKVNGVEAVHDLHVWTITSGIEA